MTTPPFDSLSQSEAKTRLKTYGPNVLPQAEAKGTFYFLKEGLKEPMIVLLLCTAFIYFALGDRAEGSILGLSVFLVVGISLFQRIRSERAIEALKRLSSPRASVIRDGIEEKIAASELVPGDLIRLSEGDRVPADGEILSAHNLNCDESLLTGESMTVHKKPGDRVFSSTLIVSGRAHVRVAVTGAATEVGKIGKSLVETDNQELRLSQEIRALTKIFAYSGLVVCVTITALYGLHRGQWLEALLVGLATELSLLPEEFPVVLTVFMALGAWRLSKVKVLVRRPEAIERLGAVSALCVDKTGTLTLNEMTVATGSAETLEIGALAVHPNPFDPMDKAFLRAGASTSQEMEFVREYALSHQLLAMSCAWRAPQGYLIACKGAPEAVLKLCQARQDQMAKITSEVNQLAGEGQRVIGVARAKFTGSVLPASQEAFDFEWVGLAGLIDPIRKEVPDAVRRCRSAGIRVIMITGDYPQTARNIALQAGFAEDSKVLTGDAIRGLSDEDFMKEIQRCDIFARMVPDLKLRIVKGLKDLGQVVGMTGDGVNDAPSLKWADVGISMGKRGTDVAREASDIVLLDDNFASIVAGIRRGRLIFSNIRKALGYIVSIHVPIAGLSVLPVLLGWPLILLPIHIVLLELIIDPACTLLFESQTSAQDPLSKPPRHLTARLFSKLDFARSILQGLLILAVTAFIYWYDLYLGNAEVHARSLTFGILILSNIGLIVADLTRGNPREILRFFGSGNNILITTGLLIGLGVLFYWPPSIAILKISAPSPAMALKIIASTLFTTTVIGIWNWKRA